MMPGLPDDHPSIRYYDSDYPGVETSPIPDNLDGTIAIQGLLKDIARFREIAAERQGRTLEIGCGTGRVLIPLARSGLKITGIDISEAMIARLHQRLTSETQETQDLATLEIADARDFSDPRSSFATIIIPFNGLSCIPTAVDQKKIIKNAARLLQPGGRLVIDLVNPFILPLKGSGSPAPFFTRINPETGRSYTRFAAMGPILADQTQKLFGWYDELGEDGAVYRTPYEMRWRLIFASELELMLEKEGLSVETIEGDHQKSSYDVTSSKIFTVAVKK